MKLKTKAVLVATTTILSAALVGGATFALFTSSATNSNNTFTAGTVKITLDKQDPSGQAYFTVTNMAPGDSEIRPVIISSTGSLQLKYNLALSLDGFLGNHDNNHATIAAYPSQQDAENGTNAIDINQLRVLDAQGGGHDHETLYVRVTMPLTANDDYQNQTGTATISVSAQQTAHNGDNPSGPIQVPLQFNDNALVNFDRSQGNYFLSLPTSALSYNDGGNIVQFNAIPSSGYNNEYLDQSRTFILNASTGHSKLWLLDDGVNGNQWDEVTITYTDGSQQSEGFYSADWMIPSLTQNEHTVWTGTGVISYNLNQQPGSIFATYVPVDSSKAVKSITFNANVNLVLWGITLQ